MRNRNFTFNPFQMRFSTRIIISVVITAAYIAAFKLTAPVFSAPTYAFLMFPAMIITIQWGFPAGGISTLVLAGISLLVLASGDGGSLNSFKLSLIPPVTVFVVGLAGAAFLRGLLKKNVEREREYRTIVSNANSVIVKYNMEGEITFFNRFAEELFGYSAEEVLGKKGTETINKAATPEERREMDTMLREILINTGQYSYNENKNFREDGSEYWMAWTNAPLFDSAGNKTGILCIGNDITAQKNAELAVQQRLEEKDILLREIHHRVKNNLQIISSILSLQEESMGNEEEIHVFKSCENRISSMALVHDHLYHAENIARIDVRDYITALTGTILDSYYIDPERLHLRYDIAELYLGIDQAIPCGLILTELITNSIKHAFMPKEGRAELGIIVAADGDLITMKVADNGPGFEEDGDWRNSESLGLRLVNALAEQLQADISVTGEKGMVWQLQFQKGGNE